MKLGVLTVPLSDMPLREALPYLRGLGVQTVELGAGGYTNPAHLRPEVLLKDKSEIRKLKQLLKENDMEISALSCHGNSVHPNREIAARADQVLRDTICLANELEVGVVNTFSGCPGDCENSERPNWVTCAWPGDYPEILKYQWEDKLLPYWEKAGGYAQEKGVKIAFEIHPGFCVYNTETMLRIHREIGPVLGANFDPSHLFWQGVDIPTALRALKGMIYNFHAKDCRIDPANTARTGVLDTKSFTDAAGRSWIFRTVGYGHDAAVWKDIISELRKIGYDGAVTIEHEDCLMSGREGLEKAVQFLKDILIYEEPGAAYWA